MGWEGGSAGRRQSPGRVQAELAVSPAQTGHHGPQGPQMSPRATPQLLPWPQEVHAVAPEGWRPWEHHLVHSAPQNVLTHWLLQEEAGSIFREGIGLGLHRRGVKWLLLTAMEPLLHTQCPNTPSPAQHRAPCHPEAPKNHAGTTDLNKIP